MISDISQDRLQRRRLQLARWLAEEVAERNHPDVVKRYHARIRRIDDALEYLERRRRRIHRRPTQDRIVGQHITALTLFQQRRAASEEKPVSTRTTIPAPPRPATTLEWRGLRLLN